jgi:hypothetical protein
MFIESTPIVSSLQSKFLKTAASAPWPAFAGARFISYVMRDLDGDGRDEVIALCPSIRSTCSAHWAATTRAWRIRRRHDDGPLRGGSGGIGASLSDFLDAANGWSLQVVPGGDPIPG